MSQMSKVNVTAQLGVMRGFHDKSQTSVTSDRHKNAIFKNDHNINFTVEGYLELITLAGLCTCHLINNYRGPDKIVYCEKQERVVPGIGTGSLRR